jgi:hypothetical protein
MRRAARGLHRLAGRRPADRTGHPGHLCHQPRPPLGGPLLEPVHGRHDAGFRLHERDVQLHLPVRLVKWSLPLSFVQPAMVQHETDVWVDKSAVLNAGGRCTVTTADTCVDGPATKAIEGRPVTRACWSYERTLTCTSGAPVDECAALASSGCTPASSTCKQMNVGERAVRDHPGHLYLPGRRANHHHRLELPGQRLLPGLRTASTPVTPTMPTSPVRCR